MNGIGWMLALGSAVLSVAGSAQDAPRAGMGLMRADTNGDGVVTRGEYESQTDQRFTRMDANGDGVLTPDEAPRRRGRGDRPAPPADAPPPLPGQGEGPDTPPPPPARAGKGDMPPPPPARLTRNQFRAAAMSRFERLDANRDGRLDKAEIDAASFGNRGGSGMGPPSAG